MNHHHTENFIYEKDKCLMCRMLKWFIIYYILIWKKMLYEISNKV